MHDDTTRTAEAIRNGAAWWREAADALDQGRTADAVNFAKLAGFVLEEVPADLERLVTP